MNKTKIEWCDMTWNPVTGCLHGCEYCYARNQARRFASSGHSNVFHPPYEITDPQFIETKNGGCRKAPYPFGFDPTFHRYRLDEPENKKKPQNIFVCSMADLFGEWVPDEWIEAIFDACEKAPQHRYLFLTKNPKRYKELNRNGQGIIPIKNNFWFGSTITSQDDIHWYSEDHNYFFSIEPLMSEIINPDFEAHRIIGAPLYPNWVIIGAETCNRKGKVIPKREWIENIVNYCHDKNVPVFMKSSLANIWGEPLIQEYPWGNG